MAYIKKTQSEHAYKLIGKDIKANELGNLLLFFGKEQYLINWAIGMIEKKYINEATRSLDFSKLDTERVTIDQIKENCETLSMFSEKRLVILPDFLLMQGKMTKGFNEESERELIEYFSKIPDSCIFIITTEEIDKRKKIYKELEAHGKVYDFSTLDEKQLKGFIDKRIKAAGKIAKPSIIEELIVDSGYFHKETDYTLYNLENDINKILAHSQGQEILLSDVLSTISGNLENDIFAMLDAISKNRKDEAYRLLFNLLGSGESLYMILGLIVSQFELMLMIKELREEGKNLQQINSILNVHEYRIKKALGFSEAYSIKNLRNILLRAYDVDKNIKTGALPQNLALEMFIAQI